MRKGGSLARVLAIDPTSRGFGFIVLEGPGKVVDWGVRSGRQTSIEREQQLLTRVADLLSRYRPRTLILEDMHSQGNRRGGRVRLLIESTANMGLWQGITVRRVAVLKVRKTFLAFGAQTKHEMACVIAMQLPEIAAWLPPPRKLWTGEDYRMAVFDAAALALTYFYTRKRARLA